MGIEDDKIPFLFNPFNNIEEKIKNAQTGMGIGLYISKRLVELMGGIIKVSSERGVGSVFHIILPFKPYEVDEDNSPCIHFINETSRQQITFSEINSKAVGSEGIYTLVVDDNVTNVFCLVALLKKLGYVADSASNGKEAIDKFMKALGRYTKFIVFMDINMPIMNGIEATRKICEISANKPILYTRVVAVTAQDEITVENSGFHNFSNRVISSKTCIVYVTQASC
jgi:CheY-like chemotaxis protein